MIERLQRPEHRSSCLPGSCLDCRHFDLAPDTLEAQLPGLRTLSSAYGAVRAQDGLCAVHARYVPGHARCGHFEPITA